MYNIEALPGPNNSGSQAYGLNGNGEVAGIAFPSYGLEGVLWQGGGPVFSLPPDSESILYSVNDAGDAVGLGGFNNSPTEIPILVRGGVSTDLSSVLGGGAMCTDINNAGVLCGSSINHPNAFTYNISTKKVTLLPITATQSHNYAAAINLAGHVIGAVENNDGTSNGFYYDGAMHDLGPVGFVEDINDIGQVVGSIGAGSYPASFSPVIWDVTKDPPVAQPIPLPTSDAFIGAHAESINNKGVAVGTSWTASSYDGDQTAYVYANGSSTDLNRLISVPGWRLQFATHINDAGLITGFGTFKGQNTAFLLSPARRFIPVSELVATMIFGGVKVDGGGWAVIGGVRHPIGPWGPEDWSLLDSSKRDALIGMALDELAKYIADVQVQETVRSAILEGIRTSVGQLSARGGQIEAAYRQIAAWALKNGKTAQALRRFRAA
ncbi:MAG: hypothetical protein WBF42_01695 [Terracidiphilus sp.]